MSQLFGMGPEPPPTPVAPPSPMKSDPAVQKRGESMLRSAFREGYASQFLSNPAANQKPGEDKQQKLSAGYE